MEFLSGVTEKETLKELESYVGVEFVNRIGQIYHFKPLSKENLSTIVVNKLKKVQKKYEKKGMEFTFSPFLVEKILKEANCQKFGARRIDKIVEEKIESNIVDAYCEGKTCIEL